MRISNETGHKVGYRVLAALTPEEQEELRKAVEAPGEIELVDDEPMPGNRVDENANARYLIVSCALAATTISQLIREGWVPLGHPFLFTGQPQQAMWQPIDVQGAINTAYQEGAEDGAHQIRMSIINAIDAEGNTLPGVDDEDSIWDYNPDTGISHISSGKLRAFVEGMMGVIGDGTTTAEPVIGQLEPATIDPVYAGGYSDGYDQGRADEAAQHETDLAKLYDVPPEPLREAIDKAWNGEGGGSSEDDSRPTDPQDRGPVNEAGSTYWEGNHPRGASSRVVTGLESVLDQAGDVHPDERPIRGGL